jgi:hypothetical protein
MRPTQGFEPLVSFVPDSLRFFCFQIRSTNSVEARVQDLSVVKESLPPVPEDRAAREARHLLAAQKEEKEEASSLKGPRAGGVEESLSPTEPRRAPTRGVSL